MNMYLYVCVCTYLVSISYRTFPSPWKISFCPLSYSLSPEITAPPPENCYSDFCHHRLDFPLHKLHRNEVFPYILFCVWLLCLNIMYLRFTHVVASLHNSEFFYCWVVLQRMNMQFVRLFSYWWIFGLFPVWTLLLTASWV